jgi:hypothetical protein
MKTFLILLTLTGCASTPDTITVLKGYDIEDKPEYVVLCINEDAIRVCDSMRATLPERSKR